MRPELNKGRMLRRFNMVDDAMVTPTPMFSPESYADYLGIGRRTFQSWRAAGKLPPPDLAIGRVLRWRPETVTSWLATQARKQQEAGR